MNVLDALSISSSGLTAQRIRMDLISSNLANINTTRTLEGGPYKKKEAVFAAYPQNRSFKSFLRSHESGAPSEVKVAGIINDSRPPVLKFDPGHPDADEKGFVAMPNINLIEEMVNMISASRSYEANVTAIDATKKMALKALEIGR